MTTRYRKVRHLSVALHEIHKQCTCTTETTIDVTPTVDLVSVALAEVSNAYSENTAVDILKIVQTPSFTLELINSNNTSLKNCREATVYIADACSAPPSQLTKQSSH